MSGVANLRRRDRAKHRAQDAMGYAKSRKLAEHFGVAPSTVRHMRAGRGGDPLTAVCEMVADPEIDGAPIVAAILEAYEEQFLDVRESTLRSRLAYLLDAEHEHEAEQNRALQTGVGVEDALRRHSGTQIEILALRAVLGIGSDS